MNCLSKRPPQESEADLDMSFVIHKIRILSVRPGYEATLEEQVKRLCTKPNPKPEKPLDRDAPKKPAEPLGYRLLTQSPAPSCSSFLHDAYDLGDMAKLTRNKM